MGVCSATCLPKKNTRSSTTDLEDLQSKFKKEKQLLSSSMTTLADSEANHDEAIDNYPLIRVIGKGAFGMVYYS